MEPKSEKAGSFDYIVYGTTLEGLLIGYYFHQKGLKVLILEPSDKAGGLFSSIEPPGSNQTVIPSVVASSSWNENSLRITEWIRSNFVFGNVDLEFLEKDLPPVTFEKGSFEPFVGFGENAPPEVDYLQNIISSKRLEFVPDVSEWIKHILRSGIEIRFESTLTSLNVVNGVGAFTINDKDIYKSKNFVFAKNPQDLSDLIDSSAVSQKTLSKLSKGTFWSTLQLSLAHKAAVSDKDGIHILYGTQKNPIISVGKFFNQNNTQTSQWVSFISADTADINEEGVHILKEIKRQIKRAYPNALDDLEFEKIALWPKTHGYIDLKAKQFGQIDGLENLWICSGHLIEETNPFVGALMAVRQAIEAVEGIRQSTKCPDIPKADCHVVNA